MECRKNALSPSFSKFVYKAINPNKDWNAGPEYSFKAKLDCFMPKRKAISPPAIVMFTMDSALVMAMEASECG